MNSNILLMPILIPFIGGIITLFIPKKIKIAKELLTLAVLLVCLISSIQIFLHTFGGNRLWATNYLVATPLSSFILLAAMVLSLLVTIAFAFNKYWQLAKGHFYTYSLWAITATAITVLSNNLILFFVVWGALAVLLYLLILMGKPGSEKAGYKALIMIGGSDVLMLIGDGIIYYLTKTLNISQLQIPFTDPLAYIAFILLLIGAFTKAGVMPFHTWVPDTCETAPTPVLALFISVLDKLLAVYLLLIISIEWFVLIPNSAMSIVLMSLGSLSIIAGAAMALMQNNLMKLLAYSSISQVGYMVLGIGIATPLGIIGALFHMVNNIIYKTNLFFSAGAIESRSEGKTDLDKLGGLARFMPITFFATLVSALAIAGIPPLNGFISKWLVYQSLTQFLSVKGNWYIVIFIIIAMLGSVLTLAYFLKVIYAVFFETKPKELPEVKEVSWNMYLPMILLTALTILFGVFAPYLLRVFLSRILVLEGLRPITPYGFFSPGLTTILILLGIIIGVIIFLFTRSRRVRTAEVFIGGEEISDHSKPATVDQQEASVSSVNFYDSVKKIKFISDTYRSADNKFFDIFEQARKLIALVIKVGKRIHNGLLQTYLGWLFLGIITIIAIFFLLLRR